MFELIMFTAGLVFLALYLVVCQHFYKIALRLEKRGGKSYGRWEFFIPIYNSMMLLEMAEFPRSYIWYFIISAITSIVLVSAMKDDDIVYKLIAALIFLVFLIITTVIQYKGIMRVAARLGEDLDRIRSLARLWVLSGIASEIITPLALVTLVIWLMLLVTLAKEKEFVFGPQMTAP